MFDPSSSALRVVEPWAKLIAHTPAPAALVEAAGRTCYKSEPKGDPDSFVRMILGRKHHSVLEHASASFRFVTDRGISHEIVRHRLASYSQESTRFVNYSENGRMGGIQVIVPSTVKPENRTIFIKGFEAAQHFYQAALDAGEPPQNARALLPTGTKTELVMTCNLREWRHFIAMRNAPDAHPDIRLLAGSVLEQLREVAAVFFPEASE